MRERRRRKGESPEQWTPFPETRTKAWPKNYLSAKAPLLSFATERFKEPRLHRKEYPILDLLLDGCISRDGKEEKKLLCLLFGSFFASLGPIRHSLAKSARGEKGAIEPLKLISVRPCTLLHRRFLLSYLWRPNFGIRNCQTKFLFRFPLHMRKAAPSS